MISKNVRRMARELQDVSGRSYCACLEELKRTKEIYLKTYDDGTACWCVVVDQP